jgi:hypothetical protein
MPVEVIVPPVAAHVTEVLLVAATVAVNCCCLLTWSGALCGLTVTVIAPGVEPTEAVFPTLPPPQPPMAKTNWRENKIRKADNQL